MISNYESFPVKAEKKWRCERIISCKKWSIFSV